MKTIARLRRARIALATAAALLALLRAGAAFVGVVVVTLVVDALVGLPLAARSALRYLPLVIALVLLLREAMVMLRGVLTAGAEEVALWFERRLPSLQYALVTQASLGDAGTTALEDTVAAAPLEATLGRGIRSALLRPALLATALLVLLALLPAGALSRVITPTAGDALDRPGAAARAAADALATIVVRVAPPAYSGLAPAAHDDPAALSALAGSRVEIEGLGSGVRLLTTGQTVVASSRRGGGWTVSLPMPDSATAVRLEAPGSERILLLDPIADSVPEVQLALPERDTVLRVAEGRVVLAALLRDDLGLSDAAFEFIVSAGAGETFTFRTGMVGAQRFNRGVRAARIETTLALDTLRLQPGDLVHLRAVAQDRNDVTGPGRGVSETRTIRVARADEYDSVSVEPAPPPALDTAALSQRMILIQTEELHAREPSLSRGELSRASRLIAADQTKLRKRVGEAVFQRLGEDNAGEHSHFAGDGHAHGEEGLLDPASILAAAERAGNVDPVQMLEGEGDETPIVAINRPLLEAYNHMWRASTELETANPGEAIPWMRRAIEALQRARAAERIYLRGRPPRVVVDLARVRGTGKDESAPAPRVARAELDPARAMRLTRFDVALQIVQQDPRAAADSLLLIRITVPADERATAIALDAAATALRRGGNVTNALAAARRALAGEPPRRGTLSAWGH